MPLVIPESYQFIRHISFDPGLNNTGAAIIDQCYQTGIIKRVEAHLLVSAKLRDHTGMDEENHAERAIKLMRLHQAVLDLLHHYNPSNAGSEAPFFNRLMPMAYGALCEVVNTIYSSVINYNPNIQFAVFPPLTVKKVVGAKAISNDTEKGKFEVKKAIMANPEIMAALVNDIETLSEHELDAIAVGFTLAKSRSIYHGW